MKKSESPALLEARKRDLYASLQQLERDRADGLLDDATYAASRQRYEIEAAGVLERIDRLDSEEPIEARPARRRSRRLFVVAGASCVVVLAVGILLISALRARTGNAAITGDVGQATPTALLSPTPRLLAAQRAEAARPNDINAVLQLASAYFDAGNVTGADRMYSRAIRLDPRRPDARTMHALLEGTNGRLSAGLTLIGDVESQDPRYAKAWFVDGFLASRSRAGLPRAIRSWRRFLELDPHSSIASEVRALLAAAEKAQRKQG
ncbi:MAG TPA: hypothetical protein VF221_01885 [Chloroflexota bacterium]